VTALSRPATACPMDSNHSPANRRGWTCARAVARLWLWKCERGVRGGKRGSDARGTSDLRVEEMLRNSEKPIERAPQDRAAWQQGRKRGNGIEFVGRRVQTPTPRISSSLIPALGAKPGHGSARWIEIQELFNFAEERVGEGGAAKPPRGQKHGLRRRLRWRRGQNDSISDRSRERLFTISRSRAAGKCTFREFQNRPSIEAPRTRVNPESSQDPGNTEPG